MVFVVLVAIAFCITQFWISMNIVLYEPVKNKEI